MGSGREGMFSLISHHLRFRTPPPLTPPQQSRLASPRPRIPTHSPRSPPRRPGTAPPGLGLHLSPLCAAWGCPGPLAPRTPIPEGDRGGAGRGTAPAARGAAGGAAGGGRALAPIRGLRGQANPPLGRPASPRPGSPGRRASPSAPR